MTAPDPIPADLREALQACLNAAFENTSFPSGRWSTGYGCAMAVDALLAGPLAPVLATIADLRRQVEDAERDRDTFSKALVSLTCGGSEFFTRRGDGFIADADACVAHVRERRDNARATAVRSTARAQDAEARARAAESREATAVARATDAQEDAESWRIAYLVQRHSGHGGAIAHVRQWADTGAAGRIVWEHGVTFKPWADSVGIVNSSGFMRLARAVPDASASEAARRPGS